MVVMQKEQQPAVPGNLPIIWLSHLPYERVVKQRPYHLVNRLSQDFDITYVEPAIMVSNDDEESVDSSQVHSQLRLITPRFHYTSVVDRMTPKYQRVLRENIPVSIGESIVWLQSANYVDVLPEEPDQQPQLVVGDIMDKLSAFKNAPRGTEDRERKMLARADVIFTGGRSLYEDALSHRDTDIYLFPSSVERNHFERALDDATEIPDDIAGIPRPIVGFYGVIDERLDNKLLQETAQSLPDVSFVMIGPRRKVTKKSLPQEENIYYLGRKDYDELPAYLKSFDIAMMPFALNESTQFISPTKTLEYMAGRKPIVSTPITDVVHDYGHVVKIADGSVSFAQAITDFLEEDPELKQQREAKEAHIVEETSWDATATEMKGIIYRTLYRKKLVPTELFVASA
jgi:glycosyltransferase involved in cell wall biosynthesis